MCTWNLESAPRDLTVSTLLEKKHTERILFYSSSMVWTQNRFAWLWHYRDSKHYWWVHPSMINDTIHGTIRWWKTSAEAFRLWKECWKLKNLVRDALISFPLSTKFYHFSIKGEPHVWEKKYGCKKHLEFLKIPSFLLCSETLTTYSLMFRLKYLSNN